MKKIVVIAFATFLAACSYNQPKSTLDGIDDELYQIKNDPISSIDESEVKEAESTVLTEGGFNTTVEDLSVEEKNVISENQIVLFDFDSNKIKGDMVVILKSQINLLLGNPSLRVMLEGRTDERGTKPYNMILGEKRALSVKQYLVDNGVPSEQILFVSLGENEPIALDLEANKEEFWKMNRSVFFKFLN